MSKIEVNTIEPQCGTTLTLGESGDTVTLGSGASQSGFGRTGTVDWQTSSIKTSTFTAANGEGYFVNTTGGAITANLPSSPSAGNIVAIKDYTGTAGSNNITVGRGGSNIRGAASDFTLGKNNAGATFVYIDGTEGWQVFIDGSDQDASQTFITASGGTVTCSGNFKIHTFTGPGTFTVSEVGCAGLNDKVDYLVIAGGAGGGSNGGGGGAGGYRFSDGTSSGCFTAAPSPLAPLGASGLTVTSQSYPIVVGGGGPGSTPCFAANKGGSGNTSSFSTISSAGGGGGGSQNTPVQLGASGGSGGGGGQADNPSGTPDYSGGDNRGAGNTPPVSPPQGNPGGQGSTGGTQGGGGGGGAGAVGGNATPTTSPTSTGGAGGAGITSCISASPVARGGGGGGSGQAGQGAAGSGGGGAAGNPSGTAGTANTGGGGGGSHPTSHAGGAGGSGVVIIRYRYQ